jgi:hypothetical protein
LRRDERPGTHAGVGGRGLKGGKGKESEQRELENRASGPNASGDRLR